MTEQDFPALYRSADKLSLDSQKYFFLALFIHILFLAIGAVLSLFDVSNKYVAFLQTFILLSVLGCSIYLFVQRPDKYWYAGRAVAESIKTLAWRYVCKAEPFQKSNEESKSEFRNKIKQIYNQNKDFCQKLTENLGEMQITDKMINIRELSLDDRVKYYREHRIKNQLIWYQKKATFNKKRANYFFGGLIAINAFGILFSLLRIAFTDYIFPTDVMITLAGGLLTWIQAKRFTELSASYALTAHEISLMNESFENFDSEDNFSSFVGDAENAFSREHTQWVARRDI